MNECPTSSRYCAWPSEGPGAYALESCQGLLRHLLSGWPRRSRSVIAFGAGNCSLAESLWEAGFDVTAQADDPVFLEKARLVLGNRADFVLSSPEHLPFDDDSFDYAVAALALEFWQNPEAVLAEMARLATSGAIILFPNRWSLFALECAVRRKNPLCALARPLLLSPRRVRRLAEIGFGKKRQAWASVLPLCSLTWKRNSWCRRLNSLYPPLPLGAFAGLRVDFGPRYTGTPLVLRQREPVAPVEP